MPSQDPNDKLFDILTENQLQLLRADAGLKRQILKDLNDLEKEILGKVTFVNSFTQRRLQAVLKQVRKTIDQSYRSIFKKLEKNRKIPCI